MPNSKTDSGGVIRGPSRYGYDPGDWFWASRKKQSTPIGSFLWYTLRTLDVPFQYWLLRYNTAARIVQRLGCTIMHAGPLSFETSIGLNPYHTLIIGLAIGSSAKQIYWKAAIGEQAFPAPFAIAVAVYNTLLNGFNTVLAVWAVTSQQPADVSSWRALLSSSDVSLQIGLALYAIGLFTEWYSEVQRKAFKQDPANKGKPYSGGLWSLATNINYGGYTLWRGGYALICGSWIWAAVMCAWLASDFIGRAIPSMDAYCEKRYGTQWEKVRKSVRYRLLPGIY